MEYRVLARKYRPSTFDDLVGQDVLVRTLANAFKTDRIAHAFLLTGIRGIGKTTTARIIARALNCIGEDGQGGPTTQPCGVCDHCKMIGEDRHPDVLELDAASRTGVDDIRELIDSVRYLPSSAGTKVYIIDEVHMLSNNAFNALLKTLEEPPAHVKFVFATTEARKIPVTILSRCQRFDLRRLDVDALAGHLGNIAQKENVAVADEALTLLAMSAEGSVRDGLSLLDQAIAHQSGQTTPIDEAQIRSMLGLADRSAVLALLESLFKGDASAAMDQFAAMYHHGADPLSILQDCLELLHFTTRVQVSPKAADDPAFSDHERQTAKHLATELTMPVLTRAWQMLLKGLSEAKAAPSAKHAVEMVLVRMAYVADLPSPAELIKSLDAGGNAQAGAAQPTNSPAASQAAPMVSPQASTPPMATAMASQAQAILAEPRESYTPAPAPTHNPSSQAAPQVALTSLEQIVDFLDEKREALVASQLREYASLVSLSPGRLEIYLTEQLGREFTQKVASLLTSETGQTWNVSIASAQGAPTMADRAAATKQQQLSDAAGHPSVQAAMQQFPGAELVDVTE